MDSNIAFSENIIEEMAELAKGEPTLSSDKADLFLSKDAPVAAIKIKIAFDEYFEYLKSLPPDVRPDFSDFVPQEREDFQILVNVPIVIKEGKTFIGENEIVLL